ncbi:Calcium-transporting ATPase 2, endoplasmic reticulum-type [Datura stramonium]|uniref:Calcium-transporting ATPase 2, endoplasmic reticulum-type n=1 Tax=Datura stramonium TaxID=4076 RepID=A0ABS8V839_DATST|nr:Calcium-transporting ATPase 2, endoplasmic reticulum-type [Datura stramonium]
MVLADDNFSIIVSAVAEGRSIHNNMKAFIRYMISSNVDGPPATALGFNPADVDIMQKPPRKSNDALISSWVFFPLYGHWFLCGYCNCWHIYSVVYPGFFHGINLYFTVGKVKAMTLSLSVLVAIEMFNSLNALSEDNSLIRMPPWRNPWLLVAMSVSFGLHSLILYVPFLSDIFGIVPLSLNEWILVILLSAPVILIDEVQLWGVIRRRTKLKAAMYSSRYAHFIDKGGLL